MPPFFVSFFLSFFLFPFCKIVIDVKIVPRFEIREKMEIFFELKIGIIFLQNELTTISGNDLIVNKIKGSFN